MILHSCWGKLNTQRGIIHIKMFFHDVERFVLDSIVILGWRRNAENLHLNKVRLFLLAKRQYIVTVTPCCSYLEGKPQFRFIFRIKKISLFLMKANTKGN